jgi:hypothetical protein
VWPPGPDVNGKIQKAIWVAESFPEEIEADLQRYYRLSFAELFRPGSGLTWRRLLVLIDHLPPEAALNTAIRNITPEERLRDNAGDPVKARWSNVESLLATLIDEVRNNTWVFMQANSDKAIPRPDPIPRPGITETGRKLRRISLENARKLDPRLRNIPDEEAQARLDRLTRGRHGN